jgi:hypothetical protein
MSDAAVRVLLTDALEERFWRRKGSHGATLAVPAGVGERLGCPADVCQRKVSVDGTRDVIAVYGK